MVRIPGWLEPARRRLSHVLTPKLPSHLVCFRHKRVSPRAFDHVAGAFFSDPPQSSCQSLLYKGLPDVWESTVRLEVFTAFGKVSDKFLDAYIHAVFERGHWVTAFCPMHRRRAELLPCTRAKATVKLVQARHEARNDGGRGDSTD